MFELAPETTDLATIEQAFWKELALGIGEVGHPWSYGSLATDSPGGPQQRLIVLRGADADSKRLLAHTDRRSPKVSQIRNQSRVSLLIYHPQHRIQVLLRGQAHVLLSGVEFESAWTETPEVRFRNYLGVRAPGTPSRQPSRNLPASVQSTGSAAHLSEVAKSNFAVIEIRLSQIEFLWLQPQGNLRAVCQMYDETWMRSWLEA